MNILDIFIILFLITAVMRGVELGLVRQLCSTIGLIAGLFLGVFIQSKVIHLAHTPNTKALLALVVILLAIGAIGSAGEFAGSYLKRHIEGFRLRAINGVDKTLGSLMGGATLLLVVWLAATIFANVPANGLERQIKNSVIVAQLNKSLPVAPNIVSRLGHLIDPNSFPNVFTGLEPSINTSKPLPSIGELDPAVQKARASVVKIEGEGCGGISEGSGYVAAADTVVTNAHVVAGVARPTVLDANGRHRVQVIWFDPNLDLAVLHVTNLAGLPLAAQSAPATNGTPAAILGYPGGGDFTADPASVIESFKAVGRNIYNQGETVREVSSIKGTVEPGNSGGPLINENGTVIGLIFAESTTYDNVGYALAMAAVNDGLSKANAQNQTVSTGSCAQ